MSKRVIEPSIEKSKEVAELLKKTSKKTEIRRITYMVSYLRL
jgi:hypothetical protein